MFTAASAWAALSPTVGVLIAARAVQGAGAAMVMPLTLTLISAAFPADKRGVAIGLWGGIAGLAVAGGPVIGGAVVEGLRWHWIFWLNVPVGLAVIPLAAWRLRESFGPRARLDVPGLALAGAGLFGLTWGLVRAGTAGWASGQVIGALAAGAALLGLFVAWEQRARAPMLPLALFRRARFTAANGVSFFMNASVFGALFLMTQFLQSAQHYTPLQAGVRMLPWTAAAMVISPVAGKFADRYGNRPFMTVGLLLQAVGLAWIAAVAAPGLGYAVLGAALTVAGVGIGLVFPTVATEVMTSVPGPQIGVASGTNSAMQQLGGVFGVAVLAAVFARPGAYTAPAIFTDGLQAALWVGAAFSAAGVLIAISVRPRPAPAEARSPARPEPATAGTAD
jgi:EmrB/QacA subfamily drug resistance transporter